MPPLPTKIFRTVTERDVDLLILEELLSSPRFRTWWLSQLDILDSEGHTLVGVWHSYTTETGESDVLLVVDDAMGQRHGVMIEDKIYAPPQPDQAARYFKRGEEGKTEGLWHDYRICITAPTAYLETTENLELYPFRVTHEGIQTWFEGESSSARAQYKIDLLKAAVRQAHSGYVMKVHGAVTAFWRVYWDIAVTEFPELKMRKPGNKGPKSRWIFFGAPGPGLRLIHKLDDGYVDLEVSGMGNQLPALRALNRPLLDGGPVHLRPAEGSAVFQIDVESIDPKTAAEEHADEIRAGLLAAQHLLLMSPNVRLPGGLDAPEAGPLEGSYNDT